MRSTTDMTRNVAIAVMALSVPLARAIPETQLRATDADAYDYFGCAVALDGELAVVGARCDDDAGATSGSAYVFALTNGAWAQVGKLTANDGASQDFFGSSVGVSSNRIVVGAYGDDDRGSASGSAYLFERNGSNWMQTVKLLAADGARSDSFGYAVAISGEHIVVGAYGDDDDGSSSGSAYVFERAGTNWVQAAKLTATDASSSDRFGYAVASSGGRIVVGAVYADSTTADRSGAAYVFAKTGGTWTQTAKLTASDGASSDIFGTAVAISGERIVVGASADDDAGLSSGSAYVFERVGGVWQQAAKLTAGDAAEADTFGTAVGISGTNVVVGAPGDQDKGLSSGAACVFLRGAAGWAQAGKLTASDGAAGDGLGNSVGVSGSRVLCGANSASRAGLSGCGAAYLYDVGGLSNTVPVVRNQTVSLLARGERYIDLDFADPDGQAMTFRILDAPAHGVLESYADRYGTTARPGRYFYSWESVSAGDRFTWEVDDGVETSAVATVSIQGWNSDAVVTGSDWPQWRGPNRDGVSPEKGWLYQWPPVELWRATIASGFAASMIKDGRLYTSGYDAASKWSYMYCLDALTGTQVWRRAYGYTTKPVTYSCTLATPAVTDDHVYTQDQWGQVYAFDRATGTLDWSKDADLGTPYAWGYGGSPLVEGNLIVLSVCGRGAAVERDGTHAIAWPATPEGVAGFPSPVPYTVGTNRFVALATGMAVLGVHAASGDIAWSYPLPGVNERCQDPIVYGDSLLFAGYGYEWVRLRPGLDSAEVVWTNATLRTPDSGSGVLWGDHVYTPTSNGGILCFDARDGTPKWWRHMMPRAANDGTLVAADGKLIVYWAGRLYVLNAAPDGYDEEGRMPVDVVGPYEHGGDEYARTTPTLSHGKLYLRQKDLLICYQVGPDPPSDTNQNAVADAWEQNHFPEPPCSPAADPDHDGACNLHEYLAGTDPTNPASCLSVHIDRLDGNAVVWAPTIAARGPGYEYKTRYYSLVGRTSLLHGAWRDVSGCTNRLGDDSVLCFTNSSPDGSCFYRVAVRLE